MDDTSRPDLTVERLLELGDLPIDDDAALLERARSVVRKGVERRLWLLVIDADGLLVPQVTLIDGTPVTPEAEARTALRRIVAALVEAGCSVAFVLERPGPPSASPDDWAWHDVLRHAGDTHAGAVRGVLLAHSGGVELLRPALVDPAPPG